MKQSIEEKAQDYAIATFDANLNAYKEMPWNKFRDTYKAAYLAGATEALAAQWRSVEEELPEAEQDVLVAVDTNTNHQFAFAWLSTLSNGTLRWYSYDDTLPLDNIRYWLPIPELPKRE